jgi:hypothetical protein
MLVPGGKKFRLAMILQEEVCRPREITQGCFTVFPVFLEIDRDAMCQIFVMFLPEREGFFSEKLFIICDNYSHQEVELLGDCIMFSNQFLKVNVKLTNTPHYLLTRKLFFCRVATLRQLICQIILKITLNILLTFF